MILPLVLVSAPPVQPVYARTVACVLELRGSLNTRRRGAAGIETVSETFQVAIHGWLEENESASGPVTFTFTAAQDPRFPPTGMLNHHLATLGKLKTDLQFYGSQVRLTAPLRFSAGLRGQNLYPSGALEIGGHASIHDTKGIHDEPRVIRFVPFPEIRRSASDFAAPTLRFSMSTLWRLKKTQTPFAVKGSVTYANSAGGASYAGRVEVVFKLDPRTSR